MRRTEVRIVLATAGLIGLLAVAGCAGEMTVPDDNGATEPPASSGSADGTGDADGPDPGGDPAEPDDSGSPEDSRPSDGPDPGDSTTPTDLPTPTETDTDTPTPTAPSPPDTATPDPETPQPSPDRPTSSPDEPAPDQPSRPTPEPPIEGWAALISASRTGDAPEVFRDRDRYVSCGDLVRAHGQELLPPEIVDCLDAGADGEGAEAAIAVPTDAGAALIWFVRVGPSGAEVFVDATRDSEQGSWTYATCDPAPSISTLSCAEPEPVPAPGPTGEDTRPEAGEEETIAA